jgi:hypothetical protein
VLGPSILVLGECQDAGDRLIPQPLQAPGAVWASMASPAGEMAAENLTGIGTAAAHVLKLLNGSCTSWLRLSLFSCSCTICCRAGRDRWIPHLVRHHRAL